MASADGPLKLRQILPNKFRELTRRTRKESDLYSDVTEYSFEYSDQDSIFAELAELYSYSEEPDLHDCENSFDQYYKNYIVNETWRDLKTEAKKEHISQLLLWLGHSDVVYRSLSTQCLLYLCQGNYMECNFAEECLQLSRENIFLLYECNVLQPLLELIHKQAEEYRSENRQGEHVEDSVAIRITLSILYTMLLLIGSSNEEKHAVEKEKFLKEISSPFGEHQNLGVFMLQLVFWYEKGLSVLPIRKIVLIFWKYLLFTLGNFEDMERIKQEKRKEHGLNEWKEPKNTPPPPCPELQPQFPDKIKLIEENDLMDDAASTATLDGQTSKRLPWKPKARQQDIELYLSTCRQKFLGYQLEGDTTSLVGLPNSIQEGVEILRQHLYVSLGDVAMQHHEKMLETAKRNRKKLLFHPPTEKLYQSMLPIIEDSCITLLKVLLASATNQLVNKGKTNCTLNILCDVLPEDQNDQQRTQKDVARHKEIITKAVSASLLLLLKHFRLNHVYQYEYISMSMFYANCIPLVLKFLNQDMVAYVTAQNSIPNLDFPACVFEQVPAQTSTSSLLESDDGESLEANPPANVCWRNMFSTINMLRLIQKLTKWRPPRIMILHVFKSAPILKKTMRISHDLIHLYVLKLFKLQAKYLGKNWRKANMKILSNIYQKVRHRLLDDWTYGNDLDSRQWEQPNEEQQLKANLDMYHSLWYKDILVNANLPDTPYLVDDEETVMDIEVLLQDESIEIPKDFHRTYQKWLKSEVYDKQYDWDILEERFTNPELPSYFPSISSDSNPDIPDDLIKEV